MGYRLKGCRRGAFFFVMIGMDGFFASPDTLQLVNSGTRRSISHSSPLLSHGHKLIIACSCFPIQPLCLSLNWHAQGAVHYRLFRDGGRIARSGGDEASVFAFPFCHCSSSRGAFVDGLGTYDIRWTELSCGRKSHAGRFGHHRAVSFHPASDLHGGLHVYRIWCGRPLGLVLLLAGSVSDCVRSPPHVL